MFVRLAAVLVAVFSLFISCESPTQTSSSSTLSGYYKSSYGDGFEVSGSTLTQYDDSSKTVSFAGTIENGPNLSSSSGLIIIKITSAGSWYKTVGTYYGIRWKNLTSSAVSESSAYSSSLEEPTTLSEAETYFDSDSLYTYYGDYLLQ